MKKLLMMLLFALSVLVVDAQNISDQEWDRQYKSYRCNGQETLKQCKARARRENIEKQRIEDSVKRISDYEHARWRRETWERERARREALTPEERAREDQERRLDFEADKKKKVNEGFDFTAGAIFSNISGTEPDYNPLLGAQLGVQTQVIPLTDDIHLGVGVQYSMQGGKSSSYQYVPGGNYSNTSVPTRLSYLNFPILARYRRGDHGFFAEAGLQPGVLLSAKKKGSGTTNEKDNFKKFDMGVPIGAGYKLKNKIGVGVRVVPGLMNINTNKEVKRRNFVASLNVSYTL